MGLFSKKPNIGKMEAKQDVEGLIKVLPYEEYYGEHVHAADAPGRIGDSHAVESLVAALKDRMSFCAAKGAAIEEIGEEVYHSSSVVLDKYCFMAISGQLRIGTTIHLVKEPL